MKINKEFNLIGGYFLQQLLYTEKGRTILFTLVEIAFTFHASNLLILYFSNKKFAKEFQILASNLKKKLLDLLKTKNDVNERTIQLNQSTIVITKNKIHFYSLQILNTAASRKTLYL